MASIKELEPLHMATIDWANDRKIIANAKVTTQALKLGSEVGELNGNLAFNNPIKDDIGDCLVVCTILAQMTNMDLLDDVLIIEPTKHNSPSVPTMNYYLGLLQDKAIKNEDFRLEMANLIHQLEGIAMIRNTNLAECWNIAYEDIKDRTGYLNEHGTYIKDEK